MINYSAQTMPLSKQMTSFYVEITSGKTNVPELQGRLVASYCGKANKASIQGQQVVGCA